MRTWQGICLRAACLMLLCVGAHAQTATPDEEYKKLIQVDTTIHPLGEHPFGEQVDLYKGALSFEETDISLAGNGPALQLSRSLSTTDANNYTMNPELPFGDWDMDIPRIETATANETTVKGWVVQGLNPLNRCTAFSEPPDVPATQPGGDTWGPGDWWYGYHLIAPGAGDQRMLIVGGAGLPVINGRVAQIETKQNWVVGCGVTADDGGEGFLAIAPDGTRYTFAHLVYRPMAFMQKALGTGPGDLAMGTLNGRFQPEVAPFNLLARRDALMYVTQVQDRFGNTLTYHYDASSGYLASVAANDGRQITLNYVAGTPLVQTVSVQAADGTTRRWTYAYGSSARELPTLTSLTLPDGSAWSYNLASFSEDPIQVTGANCYANLLGSVNQNPASGTITTPTGLTGSFSLAPMLHGRSYVPKGCVGGIGNQATIYNIPDATYQQTITGETITGSGLPSETWSYSYSPSNQSWKTDSCAGTSSCATTIYVDVTDPNQNATRYTFSNVFDATEGQLKQTDYYSGAVAGTPMRSEVNQYANPTAGPWPTSYGLDLGNRDNTSEADELSPLNLKNIFQDGDTYTWQAEAFNAYAQVTQAKRSNSFSGVYLEEATSYLNDTSLWVLGLPQTVTNVGTGEVESSNTYAGNDTLLTRSRFGQQLMSYTFNTAGQLASFTDGNTHTTSLGSYKRGIPQTITYPDSTTESLVVDDFGQISSITDQTGHATSYGYDSIGRVTSINYPGGDETAWAPQSFTYTFVTSAERGLAANHWKRTSTLGGANTVTYFDAMLRPVLSDSDIGSTVQASTLTTYDSKGQKLFSAYPSSTAQTYTQPPTVAGSTTTYDALGRVTQVQQTSELIADPLLTTTTAYQSGAQEKVTDPKGNVTTTSYQVFDEPTYDKVIQVAAPTGITQTIVRDVYGNPQSITQSGPGTIPVTKSLIYDGYKRLCRTSEPESGSEVMSYDGANNLAWSAAGLSITGNDCGQDQVPTAAQTTRSYDAMNRVTMIQPPAGTQSTIYGYDAVGRMTCAVTNPTTLGVCNTLIGSNSWLGTYNFRGMLTGESLQVGAQSPWGIGYAHDANGSLSLIHYPDGNNVSYAPDALGRPTQVGSYATSVGYWPNGQASQFVYGNGSGYLSHQNTRQLLDWFSYGTNSGNPQLLEDFAYDQNGNITNVTDNAGGTRTKSFGYDALNRLTSASAAGLWGTQSYTYDALNNLLTLTTGGQTATYSYANNLLTGISGALTASYTYDTRGNVATKNGTTLLFDQKNQLTQIVGNDTYTYDAAGRRVSKVNSSGTTYYFYNQAGQLMYQNGPGALNSTDFIYLGSKLIARDVANASTISAPALSNNGSYTVSWTSFVGASTYNLQERVNGGAWSTILNGTSATASAFSGKAAGSYGYQVQACNGSTCTGWSNTATTTVVYPPAAPASISVPATSSGVVAVSWAASATATTYNLQHRFGAGGWGAAYSGAGTSTSVAEGATGSYTYQVQACNAGGCSAFTASSAVAVTLPITTAPALTVPASSSTGSYTVSWSALSGASSYNLQEQANGGSWVTTQSSGATSQNLTGRAAGVYGYRVQACNVDGCGPFSGGVPTITVSIPIAVNGQSYTSVVGLVRAPPKPGQPIGINNFLPGHGDVGFDVSSTTWEVYSYHPSFTGTGPLIKAILTSGSIPTVATTVKYTWTYVGIPSGFAYGGGAVSNSAASPVSVAVAPQSQYDTVTSSAASIQVGRTYSLRVDFYNAAGVDISTSSCTLTAELEGAP